MFRIVRVLPLIALLLMTVGCANNYYNIPRETYEKKVRVLGVAPIFLDGDSDVRFPDKEPLLALLRSQNRKNEQELVALLKDTGVYLSVRMLEAQADELFTSLFFRRELRMDAGVTYNKYFFKQQELKDLIGKNQLDALMLVVVSGLTRSEKIYSSNIMSFLETDYNTLVMTAQILDANGTILWEYPNFQQQTRSLPSLINLQYPDFDEAAANLTDKVDVKFKTLPGITRAFEKTTSSSFQNNVAVSRLYSDVFDDMVSLLRRKPKFFWEQEERTPPAKPEPAVTPTAPSQPESKGSVATPPPQPAKAETIKVEPAAEPVPPPPGEIKTEDLK